MLEIIETYRVFWCENDIPESQLPGDARVMMRVPQDKLSTLLDLLVFNRAAFVVIKRESAERPDVQTQVDALNRQFGGKR